MELSIFAGHRSKLLLCFLSLLVHLNISHPTQKVESVRSKRADANPQVKTAATKPGSEKAAIIALENCKKYAEYRYINNTRNIDCINVVPLIVGGVRVEPKEYPHMALIGYGKDLKEVDWLCGGSLISEKFVMSAAHCSEPGGKYGSAKWVLLGATNINWKMDNGKPVIYEIVKRHSHPSYVPKSTLHDITLFELNSTVLMSPYVRPACLYTPISIPVGIKATITGWGATAFREKRSESLLKTTIPVLEDKICETSYNKSRINQGFDSKTTICAGDLIEGKDSCMGDAGGPLQIPVDKEVCMWNVLGITSFGIGCANKKDPAVYTKVPYYLDWIQEIVWP